MIRPVTPDDAAAIVEIYAPIVRDTIMSFEVEPPTVDEMRGRIAGTIALYPWLVFDRGRVDGYAYAGPHRLRYGYRPSVEVSAYVREDARGRGIARSLYRALFSILEAQGFHRAFAGVGLPNDASNALHRSCGFEPVGVFRAVGYKLGKWVDTMWWQRDLNRSEAPPEIRAFGEIDEPRLLAACAASTETV